MKKNTMVFDHFNFSTPIERVSLDVICVYISIIIFSVHFIVE